MEIKNVLRSILICRWHLRFPTLSGAMLPWVNLLPKARCSVIASTTLAQSLSFSPALTASLECHNAVSVKQTQAVAGACMQWGSPSILATMAARSLATSSLQERVKRQFDGLSLQLPNSPFDKRRLGPPMPKLVLYRGRWMLLFRFLVRAKVFQLLGVFAGAAVLASVFSTTNLPANDVAALAAVLVGCVVTSYCIWFLSGRYVGELSLLLPDKRTARFSVLDFWGNRHDTDVPVSSIIPPFKGKSIAEVKRLAGATLIPLDVAGDRQYLMSVRHGHLLQKQVLQDIFYGVYTPEADQAKGASNPQQSSNSSTAGTSSINSTSDSNTNSQSGREQGVQPVSGRGADSTSPGSGEELAEGSVSHQEVSSPSTTGASMSHSTGNGHQLPIEGQSEMEARTSHRSNSEGPSATKHAR